MPGNFVAYRVFHVETGKTYIGITKDVARRRKQHFSLRGCTRGLREDMLLLGKDKFQFEVLASARGFAELRDLEKILIRQYASHVKEGGYNATTGGQGTPGIPVKDTTRALMRQKAKLRGFPELSAETIRLRHEKSFGRKLTAQALEKRVMAYSGHKYAPGKGNRIKRHKMQPRPIITPEGVFDSARVAAEHYNIKLTTANVRAKKQLKGWKYQDADKPILSRPHIRNMDVLTPEGRFRTLKEAAEARGITSGAASRWARGGMYGWSYVARQSGEESGI